MMTQFISPAELICMNINEESFSELKHWLYRVALPQMSFNPAFALGLNGMRSTAYPPA